METIIFVEKGTMHYQGILYFRFTCLHSGSINRKLKYSENDFHYFLYAFLVPHYEKVEIFHFSIQKLRKVRICKVPEVVHFEFEFQYRKTGKYAFPQKKEGIGIRTAEEK